MSCIRYGEVGKGMADGGCSVSSIEGVHDSYIVVISGRWIMYDTGDWDFKLDSDRMGRAVYAKLITSVEDLKRAIIESYGLVGILYEDHWLPTDPPRCATRMTNTQHLMVSDIIIATDTSQQWDLDYARQLLNEEDFQLMLMIYLPQTKTDDFLVWPFNPSGNYTVKSGYKREMLELSRTSPDLLRPRGDPLLNKQIWTLPILPKLKHFLWRLITLALGTNTIQGVTLGYSATFTDDLDNNMRRLFDPQSSSTLTLEQKLTPFWILWKIWKLRNNLIFKNQVINPQRDAGYVTAEVRDCRLEKVQFTHVHREANGVAHILATKCNADVLFTSTLIPHWLSNVIRNDYIRCT
ncbi:hypothetical protein DY000_02004223 [Brassica cretica]|uniref:RNase H type-1 domain-containing protein n=1 Tax=Brassica cretica TaxID=69181 RepID=A0ABQ7BXI4_BRACR|nr:hypothetical protein DY000_02004223 [Brassica cretica]